MTNRQKVLVTVAASAVVLAVLFVGYVFVYSPLVDAWDRRVQADEELKKAQADLSEENRQGKAIVKLSPRLEQWKKLSLPPRDPSLKKPGMSAADQKALHLSQMKTEYERYLSGLLRDSGMKAETIKIVERSPDKKFLPPPPKAKGATPTYHPLAFGVSATGPQAAVYRALRDFHKTNLLHQVRSLTVAVPNAKGREKPDPKTLDLSMVVEALIVEGADDRAGIWPKTLAKSPRVLAEPDRDYNLLSKRSLFTGLASPPPPPREVVKRPPPPPPPPSRPKVNERERMETLEWVKVTMLAWNPQRLRWEATLYDQAQGKGDEIKVDTRLYKTFTIYSEKENAILEAKVMKIDEEQLIFQAEGKYYRARLGDFLHTVWKEPLTSSEVRKLGL